MNPTDIRIDEITQSIHNGAYHLTLTHIPTGHVVSGSAPPGQSRHRLKVRLLAELSAIVRG